MLRAFSIFLILFFGLGPLSAFVDSSADAGLPLCCRRHGTHQCALNAKIKAAQIAAMRAGRGIDPEADFSAPPTCPLYHGPMFSMLMPAHALTVAPASFRTEFSRVVASVFERMAAFSRPSRTHAGRGPPSAKSC
jgi:hypothetical protein